MAKPIRLMLVDDHDVVRAGLKSFLQTQADFEVVGEAGDGGQAVQVAIQTKPDVILMDITMPNVDGLEATRRLRVLCPNCLVLALTVHYDKQYFMEMLSAGASGYITKQAAPDELISAIHSVASGQIYLKPALARWLLEDYQRLVNQIGASASRSVHRFASLSDTLTMQNGVLLMSAAALVTLFVTGGDTTRSS